MPNTLITFRAISVPSFLCSGRLLSLEVYLPLLIIRNYQLLAPQVPRYNRGPHVVAEHQGHGQELQGKGIDAPELFQPFHFLFPPFHYSLLCFRGICKTGLDFLGENG